jgi:hypothetical protein
VIARRVVGRLIGAAVAGLALVSGSVVPVGSATAAGVGPVRSARPAAAGDSGLELKLGKVSPAAPGPDDELVITGSVRNVGGTAAKNPQILLWLRPEVLPDRAAINTWLAAGSLNELGHEVPVKAKLSTLASGASAQFRIDVPPGELGLFSSSDFGPRAIGLQAKVGGKQVGALRSTIVWTPAEVDTPTRLSLLVPITDATASTHAGEPTAEIAGEFLDGGRLQRVLAAAHDPGMAWAIDPAILTAAQRLSKNGIDRSPDDQVLADAANDPDASPSPSSDSTSAAATSDAQGTEKIENSAAKPAAADWLSLFKSESRERGLFGLPYADPDLTAVLRSAKGVPLLRDSDALGKAAATEVLGAPIDTTLAWPANGRVNTATTRSLIKLKRETVVLADSAQKPKPEIDFTPTGRSTVRGSSSQSLTGLLYDEQLSTLLSAPASQSAAGTQTMLAQLAAITMEQPDTGRHLLAVTPRTWNPDPTAVQYMMNALGSAPWISLRGISELQKASGPPRAKPRYPQAATKAELAPGSITAAQVLDKGLTTFAPILVDQTPVQPLRERVASLLSVAWRQDRRQLPTARIDVANDVNKLVNGVRLEPAKLYTFTAREQKIPVTVQNKTDYEVKVVVRLTPRTGQLTIGDPVEINVKPKQDALVRLDIKALASGDARVEGKLLRADGVALSPSKIFIVRLRPNWESWGMIAIGSILALLLVIGLLRGMRRGRKRTPVPIEAVPDVDEAATEAASERGATGSSTPANPGSTGSSGTAGWAGAADAVTGSPAGAGSASPTVARPSAPSASSALDAGTRPDPTRPSPASGTGPAISASATVLPGPWVGGLRTLPAPGNTPGGRLPPVFVPPSGPPTPDPTPTADPVPVPISMPGPEPDPKARGGPVRSDGARPPAKTRVPR